MVTITIDTTSWNVEVVKSFTTVSAFKEAHATYDWFTPEYLSEVYKIIKALK